MSQEQPEAPLDTARRHVAGTEAKILEVREILRETELREHREIAEAAKRVLEVMESALAALRAHLRSEEQRKRG
jgi:hypothetical protein